MSSSVANDNIVIGLNRILETNGIKQKDLAKWIHVTDSKMSKIMNGYQTVDNDMLHLLYNKNVDINTLFSGDKDMPIYREKSHSYVSENFPDVNALESQLAKIESADEKRKVIAEYMDMLTKMLKSEW